MGVPSALFELGGMCVIHDASGCNSTYSTHDEPRWYDSDSMVYISGLTEMEALMGDDEKLIGDVVDAAEALKPKFIAICGTPIPMMTGFDFDAAARVIEKRSGIPSMGFPTNGMRSYISGAEMAFLGLAKRFVRERPCSEKISVNLLGATPLDFSVNGSVESMKKRLTDAGIAVNSCWAMGDSLEKLSNAASATVNLVVSACGFAVAGYLEARFGIPYVVGAPMGDKMSEKLIETLRLASSDKKSRAGLELHASGEVVIVGEAVYSASLAAALELEYGIRAAVVCPVDCSKAIPGVIMAEDEDDISPVLRGAKTVIADPLYRPMCGGKKFVSLPHEGFSGRMFSRDIPNLCEGVDKIGKELLK